MSRHSLRVSHRKVILSKLINIGLVASVQGRPLGFVFEQPDGLDVL